MLWLDSNIFCYIPAILTVMWMSIIIIRVIQVIIIMLCVEWDVKPYTLTVGLIWLGNA